MFRTSLRGRLFCLLLGSATLAACAGTAPEAEPVSTLTKPADPFPESAASALEAALATDAYPKTTSVVIVKQGETIYENYFGAGAPGRLNNTRSATKTIVAIAIGLAIEDGHIASPDVLVWPLLEARAPEGAGDELTRAVTVRDLLTMSSAFHCDDNNDTPGNEENMYPQESWTAFGLGLPSQPDWSRDETGLGPWRYCTVGSFLLGQVIEAATGEPVDQYVRTRLFEPMGIAEAQWFHSPTGEVMTGGGLELTSTDLAKIGWMLTDNGRWQGKQVVPESWIKDMMTPHRPASSGRHYGYQIWQRTIDTACGPVEAWQMAGNGGNHIYSFPGLQAAVVLTREAYNTRGMHTQSNELIERYILPALACGAG